MGNPWRSEIRTNVIRSGLWILPPTGFLRQVAGTLHSGSVWYGAGIVQAMVVTIRPLCATAVWRTIANQAQFSQIYYLYNNLIIMSTYAIGDLQGCYSRLCALIEQIETTTTDGETAHFLFVGDIVNRGPRSLQTLRHVRNLGSRASMVLGNHDLHLLATAYGIRKPGRSDTLEAILQAPDREELLAWLRQQPLARLHQNHLIVHAGVLPQWSVQQTLSLAHEVAQALQGPQWLDFLRIMYGNAPTQWDDALTGAARLRCIVNALTRMRLCTADGTMLHEAPADGSAGPEGAMPWFDVPGRRSADSTVVFGHWSALGLRLRPNLIGLDTGCLWGGKLSAVRLEDRALFQVDCPRHQVPADPI